MHEKQTAAPDSTAVRVALWRAIHVQSDPPPPARGWADYNSKTWKEETRPERLRVDRGLCVFCKRPAKTVHQSEPGALALFARVIRMRINPVLKGVHSRDPGKDVEDQILQMHVPRPPGL